MNNRIIQLYKPFLSLTRLLLCRKVNNQVINTPQRILSEQIRLDTRIVENIWRRTKNRTDFNNHLWEYYMQSSDLPSYATDLIRCACIRNANSTVTNFVYDMIKSFDTYIQNNDVMFNPSADQKIDVLASVLNLRNYQIIQLICDVFKIHDHSIDCKNFIDGYIKQHKFIYAAYIVSALHLQKEFDVKEILYPLLLEGNVQVAATYMTNHPDLQLKAAKFLDGYLNPHVTVIDMKSRRTFKTLSCLINVCKIPVDHCPNMQFIRSRAALSLLVHRRKQQSILEETWEEMTKNIIGDNEDLKKFLIQKLIRKKDIKTAMKIAEKFNVTDPDLFANLNTELNENSSLGDQVEDFDITYDSQEIFEEEYLKFALKREDIKLIDTKGDFINCINEICQNYSMIGIDSEWKPHFGLSRDRLALIQLAGHDKIFIFDVLLLSECLDSQDWDKLLDDIFGNPNIVKLGFGIMSDVHMILESIKGTKGKAIKFSHILDMALFYLKLQEVYPLEMKIDNEKDFTKSLSSLCDIVLGKPLSKEDRLCDWEKRPLQVKQLKYAALDAHCLLQIYDKLKEDAELKNMNFEHLSKVAIVVTTSQWKPKRKFKGVRSGKEFHVHKLIPVEHLKLIMESTFENQGKELRRLGADVVFFDKKNSADDVVKVCKTEDRIIVCSEAMHDQVKHRVSEGICFSFQSTGDHLKVSHFLHRFNAQVSTKGIHSRCIICNSKDGIKLSAEDLKILQEGCKTSDAVNVIENHLSSFSEEIQEIFADVLKSKTNIKVSLESQSAYVNEFAFLCKNCSTIS